MSWLIDLIPGGGLTALIAGVLALLGALGYGAKKIQDSGVNKQKAKEAEARAKDLEALKRAADASIGIRPTDKLHDDPRNRDNRR